MKRVIILWTILLPAWLFGQDPPYPTPPTAATNINAAEYFFDTDPGFGNGTAISGFTSGLNLVFSNITIDLSALTDGVHILFLRTQNADGEWSQTSSRIILLEPDYEPVPDPLPPPTVITDAEYFFDTDPGFGSGVPISITDGLDINQGVNLDTSSLPAGVHTVFLRTLDDAGNWSQTSNKIFLLEPGYPSEPSAATNIIAAEYFTSGPGLGGTPGFGNGTAIPVNTPGLDLTLNPSLSLTGLSNGINYIYIRTQNADGEWSQTSIKEITILNDPIYPNAPDPAPDITLVEYFFDTDPGFGQGTSISIQSGQNINLSNTIDVSSLGEGVHFLFLRSRNSDGEWSQTSAIQFDIILDFTYPVSPDAPTNIVAAEYFIDSDPGFGNGTDITALAPGLDISLTNIPIDPSSLAIGTHYLFIRTQNADGEWSQTSSKEFLVIAPTDCTSTSIWNGSSWSNGVPDSSTKAVINGNFTLAADTEWCKLEVLSNTFSINEGAKLTLNDTNESLDVNASGELFIEGIVSASGNIENNGNIVFKSNSSTSGQLDIFPLSASISGSVITERYMSAHRAFRFVTSSVTSSSSIRDTWQQGGLNPTDAGFQASIGTHITGAGGAANGFDTTPSNNPSLFTYNNATGAYTAVSNTSSNTLTAGQAYALFIRGDRTIDLNSNTSTATETTLSASGSLLQGPQATTGPNLQALSTSPESFSLVANPYQAIVDFNALSFSGGVNSNFLYVFDPSAPNFGNFITLENPQDASDMFIRPGQSFFVVNQTTVTTPSITFNEDDKATSGAPGTTVFSDNTLALANLEMYNSSNERVDVLKLRFQDNASNGIDNFDALKLENNGENLAALVNAKSYAIERRDTPQQNDVVVLSVDNYLDTQYLFKLVTENWDEAINVYVVDNYLNTSTLIQATQDFSFTVDANIPESSAEDRFSLVFENTTLGTTDNTFGSSFSLYPNPTKDGLFSLRTPGLTGEVDVQISNVLGQEVQTQTLSVIGNEVNVNAQDLASGVYLVKLSQNDHSFTSKVIIE